MNSLPEPATLDWAPRRAGMSHLLPLEDGFMNQEDWKPSWLSQTK